MRAAGKRYILHASRTDELEIYALGDLHVGAAACHEKLLRADVAKIAADPRAFWFGLGDMVDCISYTDKRFDPDSVPEYMRVKDLAKLGMVLKDRVKDILWPIRHKCLGLLMGNHERKYQVAKDQVFLHELLCRELAGGDSRLELGLGYCCLIDVVFCRQKCKTPELAPEQPNQAASRANFRFFLHHGAGYAQTPGGKLNRVVQFMNAFDADIYFTGHVHDKVGKRVVSITANADCTHLVQRDRLGLVTGSYLKTYGQDTITYGEQRGYRPVSLGATKVTIKPDTREMRGEI